MMPFAIPDPSIRLGWIGQSTPGERLAPGHEHEPLSMQRTAAAHRAMTARRARPGTALLLTIAVAIASALLMGVVVEHAAAQTLADPNPPSKWPAPHGAAKSHTSAQTKKSCKQFGAGFVNVPGTDTCVKIGGFVTVEGGSRGR
jgi:hypothetical protein